MKILDRAQFLAMPENTLFSKYAPCYFEALTIKGETLETDDFLEQAIDGAIASTGSENYSSLLFDAKHYGVSLRMDFDCLGRDGCFETDQLFAVYEPQDVAALIERLKFCLPQDKGQS